jgi:hypothetical protein
VLQNWDAVLGEYKGEYDYAPQFDEDDESVSKTPPANLEDDDGCPNDD